MEYEGVCAVLGAEQVGDGQPGRQTGKTRARFRTHWAHSAASSGAQPGQTGAAISCEIWLGAPSKPHLFGFKIVSGG